MAADFLRIMHKSWNAKAAVLSLIIKLKPQKFELDQACAILCEYC